MLLSGCAGGAAGGSPASRAVSRAASSSVSAAPSSAPAASSSGPGAVSSSKTSPEASSGAASHAVSRAAQSSAARVASSAPAAGRGGAPSRASAPVSQTVTLSIDGSKGGRGVLLPPQKIACRSGDTVYTVLDRVCGQKSLMLSPKGASGSVYVTNIGGLSEFDMGAQSGWLYSVNGKYPNAGCNACALRAGDTVRWIYTVDNGRTEEAGS